ncbi:beta-lactamase domain protein [Paenibacillus curdlanolyticus YK9]|uniref:Beta-lactamase domain protein n=1 Tax=Paenibacillus curdlanolyticus YK9 TaxID=717606 RepID=E0I6D7_9BACL|nr:MBL fold metallo-hydrolase [Paenibacillus curdlanolyticus]EFM11603.1 beta-lactamase domain protein [Paenibacillus curdlanolyticus YK9]
MIYKQLAPDAWRIRLDIEGPLKWVNAYLFKGKDGYSVVDPGMSSPVNKKRWDELTKRLTISYADMKHIYVTHHHSDHYGLAGWLQERSNAEVWMSKTCHMEAEWSYQNDRKYINNWCKRLGGDADSLSSQNQICEKHPCDVHYIQHEDLVPVGDRWMRALCTPGHTRGHVSFYDEQGGLLICGDQILPIMMPNLTFINGIDRNPLLELLQSIELQKQLPVKVAWPGHMHTLLNFAERCDEVLRYHMDKLEAVRVLLRSGTQSSYALCTRLFPSYVGKPHLFKLKLVETYAYLQYLVTEREARWCFGDNVMQFSAS